LQTACSLKDFGFSLAICLEMKSIHVCRLSCAGIYHAGHPKRRDKFSIIGVVRGKVGEQLVPDFNVVGRIVPSIGEAE